MLLQIIIQNCHMQAVYSFYKSASTRRIVLCKQCKAFKTAPKFFWPTDTEGWWSKVSINSHRLTQIKASVNWFKQYFLTSKLLRTLMWDPTKLDVTNYDLETFFKLVVKCNLLKYPWPLNKQAQTCEMDLICFLNEISSKLG